MQRNVKLKAAIRVKEVEQHKEEEEEEEEEGDDVIDAQNQQCLPLLNNNLE